MFVRIVAHERLMQGIARVCDVPLDQARRSEQTMPDHDRAGFVLPVGKGQELIGLLQHRDRIAADVVVGPQPV